MAFSVVMPALEMAQETGKLIAWRKQEGDRVTKGEPLLEIETDKAVMEVEAPADGILAGITAHGGADIPVGQTIAWIVAPGEKPPADECGSQPARRRLDAKTKHRVTPQLQRRASEPSAVQRAEFLPRPAVLRKNWAWISPPCAAQDRAARFSPRMCKAAAAPAASSAPPRRNQASLEVPSSSAVSWPNAPRRAGPPFLTSSLPVKSKPARSMNIRDKAWSQRSSVRTTIRITHTDLLVALTARVLLKHPRLNSSWTAEGIRLHDHVNMGVAIAVNDGVVAAVIPNAHSASLAEIAQQRRDVAERARAGKLRPADIADATFTISNLGMYHVDQFTAIITPPQAAILAVGSIADRVVAVDGKPAVRPMMTLTLSCDHRAADGARAAMFLNDLAASGL